jgi:hypothetical protein
MGNPNVRSRLETTANKLAGVKSTDPSAERVAHDAAIELRRIAKAVTEPGPAEQLRTE